MADHRIVELGLGVELVELAPGICAILARATYAITMVIIRITFQSLTITRPFDSID